MRGKIQFEDIDLTLGTVLRDSGRGCGCFHISAVSGDLMDFWNKILEEYDDIVYIPMSSGGLSTSCDTKRPCCPGTTKEKCRWVNNQRISVTQQQSVLDAKKWQTAAWQQKTLKQFWKRDALDASIYIMVDTLKYLKKAARYAAAAMIGTVLKSNRC